METLNNVTISAARNIVRSHSARKRFLYVNRSFFFLKGAVHVLMAVLNFQKSDSELDGFIF